MFNNALVLQGMLNEAYALFSEAFSLLQQVSSFTSCMLASLFLLLFLDFFSYLVYGEFCRLLVPCIEKLPIVAGKFFLT